MQNGQTRVYCYGRSIKRTLDLGAVIVRTIAFAGDDAKSFEHYSAYQVNQTP